MKPSDSITKAFIQHKGEIILKNGPLERLAGDSLYCFHRLMDVFFQEGPSDKRPTNWWCVLDSVLRRNPGQNKTDNFKKRMKENDVHFV